MANGGEVKKEILEMVITIQNNAREVLSCIRRKCGEGDHSDSIILNNVRDFFRQSGGK